jgi:ferredoxin
MRVTVDFDSCEANGVCEGIAPGVFQLDEEDDLHLVGEVDESNVEHVRQAVNSCPKAALSLNEDA